MESRKAFNIDIDKKLLLKLQSELINEMSRILNNRNEIDKAIKERECITIDGK